MNQVLNFLAISITTLGLLLLLPPLETEAAEVNDELKYIVSVEGKAFFAQQSTLKNWESAVEHCQLYNMQLASITTIGQFNALNASSSPEFFYGGFWTSGRDADQLRQFDWDETDSQPPTELKPEFRRMANGIRSCLTFHMVGGDAFLYSSYCSTPSGTLCEN